MCTLFPAIYPSCQRAQHVHLYCVTFCPPLLVSDFVSSMFERCTPTGTRATILQSHFGTSGGWCWRETEQEMCLGNGDEVRQQRFLFCRSERLFKGFWFPAFREVGNYCHASGPGIYPCFLAYLNKKQDIFWLCKLPSAAPRASAVIG